MARPATFICNLVDWEERPGLPAADNYHPLSLLMKKTKRERERERDSTSSAEVTCREVN